MLNSQHMESTASEKHNGKQTHTGVMINSLQMANFGCNSD